MVEHGFLIQSTIPYGQITNRERERRQAKRTQCFLEELGVEDVVVAHNYEDNNLLVNGFLPKGVGSVEGVRCLLRNLGASSTACVFAIRRSKQV